MKIVIQRKCSRWINISNYNSTVKVYYDNLEDARADLEKIKILNPDPRHNEYRLAEWLGGRKYKAI